MEEDRCRIVAAQMDDSRCKSLLDGMLIEMEDPRCKNLGTRRVIEIEDCRCGSVAITMEDSRCQILHMNW